MKKRILFLVIALFVGSPLLYSQSMIDSVRNELLRINEVYDSAVYLTFDVNMIYSSDTTGNGDFDRNEVTGTYTFFKKKALYRLKDIEYMQNDSFAVAVYHADSFLLVGRPKNIGAGSFLPVRQLIDSFVQQLDSLYTIGIADNAATGIRSIVITATNPAAVIYEKITLEYKMASYKMRSVVYNMKETMGEYSVEAVGMESARKARFMALFSDYRIETPRPEIFDESRYIFFKSPTEILPSMKYRGFTLYDNVNQ